MNDLQETGPITQSDLLALNLRFRAHRVAITAAIEMALLQLCLADEDRDVVRFLWVDDPCTADPIIRHFRYKRVMFGVSSSPLLPGASVLLHLKKYPTGSLVVEALRRDRFADNLATGAEDQRAAARRS